MKLTIEIDLENSGFSCDDEDKCDGYEIARILVKIARGLEDKGEVGIYTQILRDINGNKCGYFSITEKA